MIVKALEATKGNVEDKPAFLAAMRKVEVDAPRGKVKLDDDNNPIQTVYVLRLWRNRCRYRPSGQFTTWLFTIARHLAIDDRRSRRPDLEAELAADSLDSPEPSDGPVGRQERFADIEQALAALPPGQREVVLLSRLAGLEANEIAVVTGSTPGRDPRRAPPGPEADTSLARTLTRAVRPDGIGLLSPRLVHRVRGERV